MIKKIEVRSDLRIIEIDTDKKYLFFTSSDLTSDEFEFLQEQLKEFFTNDKMLFMTIPSGYIEDIKSL